MTSNDSSPTQAPIFSLEIAGRLPLWNAVLGMSHWQRAKFKKDEMEKFMSALQASANDSLTQTDYVRSMCSTAADTLKSYAMTRQSLSRLKQRNARLKKASKNAH